MLIYLFGDLLLCFVADDSCNEMHYSVRGSSSGLGFELHFNVRQVNCK